MLTMLCVAGVIVLVMLVFIETQLRKDERDWDYPRFEGEIQPLRVYVAGPMTGIPDFNHPAFHAEAARLRAIGYVVVNPAEINPNPNSTWHECVRKDIQQLVTCDAISLLPGWEKSKGATLEHHIAISIGISVISKPSMAVVA